MGLPASLTAPDSRVSLAFALSENKMKVAGIIFSIVFLFAVFFFWLRQNHKKMTTEMILEKDHRIRILEKEKLRDEGKIQSYQRLVRELTQKVVPQITNYEQSNLLIGTFHAFKGESMDLIPIEEIEEFEEIVRRHDDEMTDKILNIPFIPNPKDPD